MPWRSSPAGPPAWAWPPPERLLDAGAQVVVLDLKGEEVVRELGDRARFAPADVTDENAVTAALDIAESLGPLRIVVNCAGTGNAIRVLGKDGVFPLDAFRMVVEINLIGTFNVLRLGAERIAQTRPGRRGARRHRQHRVGRGVRRPDRSGRVLGVQGRRRRHDPADRARPGQQGYPRRDDRPRPVRHPVAGRPARAGPASRSASRCRTPAGWATPTSTARWPCTSSRTRCSTARSSGSTARSGWPRGNSVPRGGSQEKPPRWRGLLAQRGNGPRVYAEAHDRLDTATLRVRERASRGSARSWTAGASRRVAPSTHPRPRRRRGREPRNQL